MSIFLTEKAIEKAKESIKKRNIENTVLRLGVKGGGCEGYSYIIQFDTKESIKSNDQLFRFDNGQLEIVCDSKSLMFLNGATLDYEVKNLFEHGFKFINNPNIDNTCSCNKSFSSKFRGKE